MAHRIREDRGVQGEVIDEFGGTLSLRTLIPFATAFVLTPLVERASEAVAAIVVKGGE